MAAKRNVPVPPQLEVPDEHIVKALYPVGESLLKSIEELQSADRSYEGWIFFLQRFYSTLHYSMTGESL